MLELQRQEEEIEQQLLKEKAALDKVWLALCNCVLNVGSITKRTLRFSFKIHLYIKILFITV